MQYLVEEIKTTFVELVGQSITILPGIFLALVILIVTGFVAGFVRRFLKRIVSNTIKSLSLQSLMVQIGYVSTWVVGILLACVLAFPNLSLGDLIALLGLGSVAIGFAFQDILKNFLAGVLLLLQEPFSIEDQIIVEDYEGTVEGIALRSTQIRTYQGEKVVIPNSIVFTSPVTVLTSQDQRRTDLGIGVDYNTPLDKAIQILMKAVQSIDEVQTLPSPEVDIVEFGGSSIDCVVRYWTLPQKKCVRRIRTQVIKAIKKACDQADINIPYPIRTLYYYDQNQYDDFQLRSSENEVSRDLGSESISQSS